MADYLARVLGGYKRMKDMGGGVHAEHQLSTLAQPDGTVITTLPTSAAQLPAALAAGGGLKVEGVAGGVALPVADTWTPTVVADVADNDSDKTLTVPASTTWQPLSLFVTLTTSADVGDRQLAVLFTTAADAVLAEVRPNVVQAASVARKYGISLGNPDDSAFYDTDLLRTPLPLMMLPAGYKIRVYDNNAVAAAADDMHIQLTVLAR